MDHFGFVIAIVNSERIDSHSAEKLERWCRNRCVRCLYFLADPEDPETHMTALELGFRQVDTRVDFLFSTAGSVAGVDREADLSKLDPASARDSDELIAMASGSFRHSRFYFDRGFRRSACDAMYRKWIERSLTGEMADRVIVARDTAGSPSGFVTLCMDSDCGDHLDSGRIGLLAVDSESRGKGLGRALAMRGIEWLAEKGCGAVRVATQARNVAAMRAYTGMGFAVDSVRVWYHKWFEDLKTHGGGC
jgi:GNAT superfamily N-acetyltransferase